MPHVHNALHRMVALQDAYRRLLGEDDPSFTGIERAGETLYPTLDLWDLPEAQVLRRQIHFSNFVNTNTAPAGRFAAITLTNPADSGRLLFVKRVISAASPNWDCGVDSGTGASILANLVTHDSRPLDTRYSNRGVLLESAALLQSGDVAAVFGVEAAHHSEDVLEHPAPWFVVAPGFMFLLIGAAAATDVQANVWWWERPALDAELAVGA